MQCNAQYYAMHYWKNFPIQELRKYFYFLAGVLRPTSRAAGPTILTSKLQLTEKVFAFWDVRL